MEPALKGGHLVINRQRKHFIDTARIRKVLSAMVPALGIDDASFTVVLVSDDAMRRYNREYRGFDKPTDVLSFRDNNDGYLGDILISSETAYNQARKSSTLTFETSIQRLLLHGLLHLMGFDHETDNGEMRTLERRLRRRFQC